MKHLMEKTIILCALCTISSAGCSKKEAQSQESNIAATQQDTTSSTEEEKNIKVTFIELGSVTCIPCKMMQPIMDEIEKEYGDQVRVVFHDVWTEAGRPYAEQYRIHAIPTQIFLDKDGNEYSRHTGFFPKEELVKVLKQQDVK